MPTTINPSDQTITQFTVQVGGASNTLVSVGPGTSGQILQSAGNAANAAYSTSTYPTTNAVSTLLYASSANVMAALATANSGVLTTSSGGVPSIDTTNFSVLSTGVQMKGNNTNTAPPAGFIGQQITASASSVATTSGAATNITNISLTAGVWDISGNAVSLPTGGTVAIQAIQFGISATSATLSGTVGIDWNQLNGPATGTGALCLSAPIVRAVLSTTTTYYLVVTNTYSATTCPSNGKITATRVG